MSDPVQGGLRASTNRFHTAASSTGPGESRLAERHGEASRFDAQLALAGGPTRLTGSEASRLLGQAWEQVTGQPPSSKTLGLMWAQWALETGRGRSMRGYNFGGLKGQAPGGGSAVLKTHEGHGDQRVAIQSRFRTYASPEAGALDYVRTLHERYPEATKAATQGNVSGFVAGLQQRGYFTADPADYSRAIEHLSAEHLRSGDFSQLKDPGPWVDSLLHTLAQAIARRRG